MASRTVTLLRRTAVLWVALLAGGGGYFTGTAVSESHTHDPVLEAPEHEAHDHESHENGEESHGHGHTDGGELPDIDPCSLVTAEEARAVLGPVNEPGEGGLPVTDNQRTCIYILTSTERLGAVVGVAGGDVYRKLASMEAFADFEAEVLPDLGVVTRWIPRFRVLALAQGEWLVSVQMGNPSDSREVSRDKAVELARAALERLTES